MIERICLLVLFLGTTLIAVAETDAPASPPIVETFQREAEALLPLVRTDPARRFLAAVSQLPAAEPRTVFLDRQQRRYYTPQQAAKLPQEQQDGLEQRDLGADRYYITKYGTPLAYSRVVELMGGHGVEDLRGRKLLDFGYGTVGHLRLLALTGVNAVGVDVDSFLPALYCRPSDQGAVRSADGTDGSVRMIDGRWPSTADARAAVGGGYDIITSKNTLKRGYIHPEREVDERMLIDLGVDDETYCRAVFDALKPGGLFVIYNLCPKQNPPDEQYIPWADGRCPFERSLLESTGFEVLAFDVVDDSMIRAMALAFGWDDGEGMPALQDDLFAWYTVVRRP